MEEIWKYIPGYEGLYQVSDLGRIMSIARRRTRGGLLKLVKRSDSIKYLFVRLYYNGKGFNCPVHKLVWEAFNGPVPEGYEISHIDDNPENNRIDNLCLMTHKENCNWGSRNEKISKTMTNGSTSKQVKQIDENGTVVHVWPSLAEIERQTGYKKANIWACCNGKRNKHKGYKWEYA